MRFVLPLLLLVLLVLPGGPALADCDIGGRAVPCAIKDGHYRIRTPEGPGPHPAVVYLYGSLGNSAEKLSHDGFVQAFVERGYAVVVPAALDLRYANGTGSGWFLRHEKGRRKRDDAKFVADVIRDAEIRHRIDRKRILIAGMSRGGFLAWEIACHDPLLAQAYAPIAAGYLGPMPKRCARPVRLLHTHGRADEIVPLEKDQRWSSGGAVMRPLSEALERVARTSGCTSPGRPERFREYERTRWQGCPRGASVDLLMHNGGHTIPLSWYSTVIDWFEGGRARTPQVSQGGARPRFKGVGSKDGGRFKRVGQ